MASTYSDLKVELIGTGEQTGTWGTTTNNNLSVALGEAITGSADVSFSGADVTITLTDTNAAQTARNLRLNLTGTSGGARNLILGSGCQIEKLYLINNGLADAVTVKNTTGTGIAVPPGTSMFVFNNGTNVVAAVTSVTTLTNSALTSGRVTYAGTNGLLQDSSNLTFNGTTLTANTIGAFTLGGTISGGGNQINNIVIGASTPLAGSFTTLSASGVATFSAGTVSAPALTTTGDTNTGIFFPAADTIAFTEGGVESMRIDSSGRVLIGASSSVGNSNANNLELTNPAGSGVCGLTFNVNSGSANTGNIYWRSNASNNAIQIVGDPISNYFAVATAGAECMRIDSSGNVGIGTSSPASRLEVQEGGTGSSYGITSATATGGGNAGYGFKTGGTLRWWIDTIGSAGSESLRFYSSTASAERMRIDSSGRVGIGTSSPTTQLEIKSVAFTDSEITLDNTSSNTTSRVLFKAAGTEYGRVTGDSTQVLLQSANIPLAFRTNGSERMRIDSSGNVGIGSTPVNSRRLTVTTASQADISIVAASNNYAQLLFGYSGADNKGIISYYNTDNSMQFYANSAERMRITSGGDLLVGTTSALSNAAKVQISGGAGSTITSETTGTGATDHVNFRNGNGKVGTITTNGSATAYNTSSDYRLKENIAPMTGALDKVAQLKPVTYKWKADGSDGQGFIAHELQEVAPYAVSGEKDGEQMQGVDYGKITPLLTAALQEALAKIQSLEARLDVLESK